MIHILLLSTALLSPDSPRRWTPPAQEPASPQEPSQPQTGEGTVGGQPAPRTTGAEDATPPQAGLLDSVQLIVNDRCITILDLQRMAAQKGQPTATYEEYVRLLGESAEDLTRLILQEQAGRDLGYDENLVRGLVRDEMRRQVEAFGSTVALARGLDRASMDSVQFEEDTEGRVYRSLWQRAISGADAGPGGRPYVDRFVRPGEIQLEFKRRGSSLDMPARIQLEEMILAPGLGETAESARQKAQLVRARLLRGEDFYELNATYGIPGRDPELAPIEEEKLLSFAPEIRDFVLGAAPGDISELVPILRSGQVAGFRILRFVGRQEGQAASFVDRQFQAELALAVRNRRDRATQDRALARLGAAAYVWPPRLAPSMERPAPPDAPPEPESAAPQGQPGP